MANEKPNCKKCRYRILLANLMDIHVWWTDCDKYGTDLCKKMNDPDFIKFMDERDEKMADRQFVVFKSEKSAFNNCICNACHNVGFVLKLELPETTYTRSGKLNTKYRGFWMCEKCAAELAIALQWEDKEDGE